MLVVWDTVGQDSVVEEQHTWVWGPRMMEQSMQQAWEHKTGLRTLEGQSMKEQSIEEQSI